MERKVRQTGVGLLVLLFVVQPIISLASNEPKADRFMASDKLQHALVSAMLVCGTGFVAHRHFEASRNESVAIGVGFSVSLGGLKEILDARLPSEQSSWKDFAADLLGTLAGAAILAAVIE